MAAKRALIGVVGLLLILPACGGGKESGALYDAAATYKCLTTRPDYLLTRRYAESNGHAPDPPPLGFDVSGTPQKKKYDSYYIFKIGPVSTFEVGMYADDLPSASLLFFDKADEAQLLKRLLLAEFPHGALSPGPRHRSIDPEFTLKRNVFIDTTPTPFAKAGPVRSLILGCLRTRA